MRSARGVRAAGTLILGAALLATGGCGYKTPPVPPATVVPHAIEDLRYTIGEDKVQLSWSYPTKNIKGSDISEVSSFHLYSAEVPLEDYCSTCPIPFAEPLEVAGGQTVVEGKRRVATYDYDVLQPGNKYFFKVQSQTGWWITSGDSNIVTFVWHLPSVAPTGLSASAADSSVELSWQPVTSRRDGQPLTTEVVYQVLRRTGTAEYSRIGKPVKDTSYVDSAVVNGRQYSYQVQSVQQFDADLVYGGISEEITVTPVDTTPPPPPEGVMAVATDSGIRVVWEFSSAEDVAAYRIYRRAEGGSFALVGTVKVPGTSFIDTKVSEDVIYYYAVTAVDSSSAANESAKSEEATPRY